jgi:hypothetical protein
VLIIRIPTCILRLRVLTTGKCTSCEGDVCNVAQMSKENSARYRRAYCMPLRMPDRWGDDHDRNDDFPVKHWQIGHLMTLKSEPTQEPTGYPSLSFHLFPPQPKIKPCRPTDLQDARCKPPPASLMVLHLSNNHCAHSPAVFEPLSRCAGTRAGTRTN